ncbi:TRAP transporter substrate-binding protein [Halomonas urumqiensis]|uniref:C4-dicarboxylate ABC transporter substrate-binding protein n=1 Tax=Halomonas urumqiensis TaxID=1684789 RepID=A0A2N7UJ59_9GAMM|nr:TRAP transporter substrate-binding protein [Halomonas urumqiensis]PMR80478.1 C4-dicarboxylate ABC transporter substrate-binding protein [Halomonas urumqiensis]PTB01677.1 C4-dicarboxylate ABC transporter substrate-binding protein [Halomonas urumqiensis]GHE22235.1 C4-dicarboxylate ABC transporter substrate-binding protein [Halomonas urumqiensis]
MKHVLSRCLLAASIAGLTAASAQAATTLRMAHFWPGASGVNQDIFEVWADTIEEESGGELSVEMFPSGTLAKPDAIYEAVGNGIADIGATAQGYTAGRFPLSQIVELPGVAGTATQGACVLQTLYDDGHLDEEYADTRPLFMFTTGPGGIHTIETDVQTPADLEGLRIRRPTAVAGDMLENMGASPVGMPAPDIYTAMQRGVIDGLSFPWEGLKGFRINELVEYHTEVPFYTLIFVATMSQRTYDSLTPEQQAVIDENSGMKWAANAGEVFDRLDVEGKQEARDAGHTIREIDNPLEHPDWQQPLQDGIEGYLTELEERGLDQAREVYEAALTASDACATSQG